MAKNAACSWRRISILSVALLGVIGIALLVWHTVRETNDDRGSAAMRGPPPPPNEEMERLIARLANAYKPPVRLFGEPIIYRPKRDETVKAEVLAKGRDIVPYLIYGLHDPNAEIRSQCAAMLAKLPTRDGLEALVECLQLGKDPCPPPTVLLVALASMTERNARFPLTKEAEPALDAMRAFWLPWWEERKDRIVDMEDGLGLRQDDGAIVPIGKRMQKAKGTSE